MEIIVEQQAQLVINQEKADERMTRLENVVGRLATISLERFDNIAEKVDALVDSQLRTDDKVATLFDSQQRLTDDVKNLVAVVDRYFSEGRNGKPES